MHVCIYLCAEDIQIALQECLDAQATYGESLTHDAAQRLGASQCLPCCSHARMRLRWRPVDSSGVGDPAPPQFHGHCHCRAFSVDVQMVCVACVHGSVPEHWVQMDLPLAQSAHRVTQTMAMECFLPVSQVDEWSRLPIAMHDAVCFADPVCVKGGPFCGGPFCGSIMA